MTLFILSIWSFGHCQMKSWVEFVSEEDTAFWPLPNAEFELACSSVTLGEEGLVLSLLSDAEFGLGCSIVLFSGHLL
jgi:hypothetical protein